MCSTSVKIQFRNKYTKVQNTELSLSNINPNNTAITILHNCDLHWHCLNSIVPSFKINLDLGWMSLIHETKINQKFRRIMAPSVLKGTSRTLNSILIQGLERTSKLIVLIYIALSAQSQTNKLKHTHTPKQFCTLSEYDLYFLKYK